VTYTPIAPGTINWDVPVNAALTGQDARIDTKVALAGDTMTGDLTARSFNTNSTVRSAFFKTTSTIDHAVTIYQAATSGSPGGVALNLISDNPSNSTVFVTGHESNRGTIKIAHLNPGAGATADTGSAALSIDLQRNTQGGTAAQGIFVTATEGPTTGSLLVLRNSDPVNTDDVAVRSDGKTGIRIPVGNTPQGSLEVRQLNTGDIALVVQGVAAATQPIAQFKNSGGTATFEIGSSGAIVTRAVMFVTNSVQFGSTSTDFGGASGPVLSMKNSATPPSSNPTGGGILYTEAGVFKTRDAAGNITALTRRVGTAVLVGGTVTVADAQLTANSLIFLTSQVNGGTPGFLRITAKTAATSFVITSSSGTDTSTVAWMVVEP
jgi:hypothetical protein